ncbi:Cell wall-associated hydrolase, NlpC family [Jatrophihabitans endophyticus]|uniref:Cell wall-associated hydrolase, NlpC family n=1 Tax=Jatrophihabitans endophyticus TaxID=1206085 RepID=A0A1M5N6V9_9ACTN|nr:NlpC/P60 family protein [Jatrophihabitans endophyticus]SHG84743.1 Cell wall-associated hydrolase, NlpC family [Jatrophihabitans endophyticus]
MQVCRIGGRRVTAWVAATTIAAGMFLGVHDASAAPTAPPKPPTTNPTDQQLRDAAAQRDVLATTVGQLSGQIAAAQDRLRRLQQQAELAEQRVAYAITQYRTAQTESQRAQTASVTAANRVKQAQVRFAQYMQTIYVDGRPNGMTGTLLTANDPSSLLQQTNYQQFEVDQNAGVIGEMQRLSVASSNARAKAERARLKAAKAKVAAEKAQQAAAEAVADQRSEQAGLEATQAQKQQQLTVAKQKQVQLLNNRATFTEYVRELREYRAYVAEQKRIAEARRQERLRQQRLREEAERLKEQARKNRKHGGHHSGRSADVQTYSPPAPSGGSWSRSKARAAIARAESTLGTPYAWAGGGVGGPSYGACVPSAGAPNDCYIRGYDCSGLVMYAWGKNWAHYADTQYNQAGSYHPSRDRLRPGDLVFFGYRGGGSDLHHVAMYLGGGRIIEAPYSGGVVQYNRLDNYSDYYGATRPLT